MNPNNTIREAIDASLCGVHFDAQDARAVLRACQEGSKKSARRAAFRHWLRFQPILSMAMLLVILVPIGRFILRAHSAPIATIGGEQTTVTEDAARRTAREGELTAQEAAELAEARVRKHAKVLEGIRLYCYPVLYAESASTGGKARHVVRCYTREVTDETAEPLAVVSFAPDGSDVVVEIH